MLSSHNSTIIIKTQYERKDIYGACNLNRKVDEKDKARFDTFCSNVGLNTSTAINLFVKAVLRENRIPFEISQTTAPFFSEANIAYVKKSVQELKAGKGTAHELVEIDDESKNMVGQCVGRLSLLADAG